MHIKYWLKMSKMFFCVLPEYLPPAKHRLVMDFFTGKNGDKLVY